MLKIKKISSLGEKRDFLLARDFSQATWIVSDLNAKFEIQKYFRGDSHKTVEEIVAYRANEFWNFLARRILPEFTVVSNNLIHAYISEILSETDSDLIPSVAGSKRIAIYVEQFLPILSDPSSVRLLLEWLVENESATIRWGQWFSLAHFVWQKLSEKKIISHNWISGLLVNHERLSASWSRELVVDLGPDLSGVEAAIFQKLSKNNDVTVLFSGGEWTSKYSKTLYAYQEFEEKLPMDDKLIDFDLNKVARLERYSTKIAEVKATICQIRLWIESGIEPSKIAVVAPDIELFWPTLVSYFDEEGIPFEKNLLVNLQSFPEVIRWLGKLRLKLGEVTYGDLELCEFEERSRPNENYELFRASYSQLYDSTDLKRIPSVGDSHKNLLDPHLKMSRNQFLEWAVDLWDSSGKEKLKLALMRILSEAASELEFSLLTWIAYLEMTCSQVEFPQRKGIAGGVKGLNINGIEWSKASHVKVIGLTEKGFDKGDHSDITLGDILRIKNDLGIQLSYPDSKSLEIKLVWKAMQPIENLQFSFSGTGFDGSVQAPALIWLQEAVRRGIDVEAIVSPADTRWDQLQKSIGVKTKSVTGQRDGFEFVWPHLKREVEESSLDRFGEKYPISLSSSKIEKYARCPFIFASENLFKLVDIQDLDMDIDRMTAGRFLHKLFEDLVNLKNWTGSEADIDYFKVVDRCREELKLTLVDERLWQPLRKKYALLAKNFIRKELEWKQQYPETTTVAKEVFFKGYWSLKSRCLLPEKEDVEDLVFRGVIDRIDKDTKDHLVLIDYKSSGSQHKNYGGWQEAKSYQLALYTQAVQKGLVKGLISEQSVVGSCIYNAKTFSREKGYSISGESDKLLPARRNFTSERPVIELELEKIYHAVGELVHEMVAGDFSPSDDLKTQKKICPTCRWRAACRAHHLN